jgi:hypothetical protein
MVNKALTGEGPAKFLINGIRASTLRRHGQGLQAARAGAIFPA